MKTFKEVMKLPEKEQDEYIAYIVSLPYYERMQFIEEGINLALEILENMSKRLN